MKYKKEFIKVFQELNYEPMISRSYEDDNTIKIRMLRSSPDLIHDIQDMLSYLYYQLGMHRLELKGSMKISILKEYDICVLYTVNIKDAQEDLETFKILLED